MDYAAETSYFPLGALPAIVTGAGTVDVWGAVFLLVELGAVIDVVSPYS